MTDRRQVLEAYLAGVDPGAIAQVTALDAAIRAAHADFDTAVKYGILMYAIRSDWRHWVCAVDARRSVVSLRFLFGVLLDDPRAVLRPGSSVLMTWDFAFDEPVDPAAVGAYVSEAVERYPDYRERSAEIVAAAREAAGARGARPKKAPLS